MAKFWHLWAFLGAILAVNLTSAIEDNSETKLVTEDSVGVSADELSADVESAVAAETAEELADNDAALLRNFFSVSLPNRKRSGNAKNPQNPQNPQNSEVRKRKLKIPPVAGKKAQQARLNHLFKALQNPIACKFI